MLSTSHFRKNIISFGSSRSPLVFPLYLSRDRDAAVVLYADPSVEGVGDSPWSVTSEGVSEVE